MIKSVPNSNNESADLPIVDESGEDPRNDPISNLEDQHGNNFIGQGQQHEAGDQISSPAER